MSQESVCDALATQPAFSASGVPIITMVKQCTPKTARLVDATQVELYRVQCAMEITAIVAVCHKSKEEHATDVPQNTSTFPLQRGVWPVTVVAVAPPSWNAHPHSGFALAILVLRGTSVTGVKAAITPTRT